MRRQSQLLPQNLSVQSPTPSSRAMSILQKDKESRKKVSVSSPVASSAPKSIIIDKNKNNHFTFPSSEDTNETIMLAPESNTVYFNSFRSSHSQNTEPSTPTNISLIKLNTQSPPSPH